MLIFRISRCTYGTAVRQKLRQHDSNRNQFLPNFEEMRLQLSLRTVDKNSDEQLSKNKQALPKLSREDIKTTKSILEKYKIHIEGVNSERNIFLETPWTIEKRILLLQELGVPGIRSDHLINFLKSMSLPVTLYKANNSMHSNVNFAKNLLSYTDNPSIDYRAISDLDENMSMREYYTTCLVYYLKIELQLSDNEAQLLTRKKHAMVLFNSFTLIKKTLKFLKEDVNFSNSTIMKNRWLIGHHPGHAMAVVDILRNDLKGISLNFISKIPKLLHYDIKDLQTYMTYLKEYDIKPDMVQKSYQIFQFSSSEFKRRVENLLKNRFTLVFQKHPRFVLLVRDYHVILTRVRYLEEKNLKFATIYTLTTFHNYLEQLITTKRISKLNVKSFLDMEFGDDSQELLEQLLKHPYYMCVPLVQMYESINYLKEHFPKKVIYKHIYAMLYSRDDLQNAYEALLNDTESSSYSPHVLLPLCVYNIERRSHFTGEGVLTSYKIAENSTEDFNHVDDKETDKKV